MDAEPFIPAHKQTSKVQPNEPKFNLNAKPFIPAKLRKQRLQK